jgi:hypothetical protein
MLTAGERRNNKTNDMIIEGGGPWFPKDETSRP